MNKQNGLYITAENKWKGILHPRLDWLIKDKLKPIAFFCLVKKPLVLFYDSPANKKELFKYIWNFNESPVVIINKPDSVEIFNGFSYSKDEWSLGKLEEEDNLDNFSYFELVTGKSLQKYHHDLKYQNRVDYRLLENISEARKVLMDKYELENSFANALIGKCIFVRYLIDRNVRIKFDGKLRKWAKSEFYELLRDKKKVISFFRYLREQFNGEAFLANGINLDDVSPEALIVLKNLLEGTDLESGQKSLFDIYDFSIIPVEFISNVYEHFIGSEKQAEKGAYYTPIFLVEYILSETVEKYFEANPDQYNCKVLDPACGSGIFLVETLRRMIERYMAMNNISPKTKKLKPVLKQLAENNIFGIDQDENAINVAIFSVYLALLDYQDPKDIESFDFPKLKQNGNFYQADFFNLQADFNSRLSKVSFDFILGNPPWKRGSSGESLYIEYIKKRRKKEKISNIGKGLPEITISNKEIAQAFLLRTSDFSQKRTKCALIVTSKTLYNLNAKDFRSYFICNYFIEKVFELAPVGKEVFRSADTPAVVLFYRYSYGNKTDKNILKHITIKPNRLFSLFKIFSIQRNDYKTILQVKLKENDWLWKVLVWGSYQDFNLIKRLKNDYISIDGKIKKDKLLVGQGIIVGDKDKKYNTEYLIGKPLVNHKKDIEQFHVSSSLEWSEKKVTRDRNQELFKAPILLVKHGLKELKAIAAILYQDALYQHSLTGISEISSSNNTILRTLCGLLNSELFTYYIINASAAGTDRGRAHDKEKFSFPYRKESFIEKISKKIETICKDLHAASEKILNTRINGLKQEKERLIDELNEEILNSFGLNAQEKALVDYSVNVTVPLIMRYKGYEKKLFFPLREEDDILNEYADLFISRFSKVFNKKRKNFEIEIWHTNYIVGMFFKALPQTKTGKKKIVWKKKSENDLFARIAGLGIERLTESIFIHKDIRGFEREGFYVIKPNERKLWHKAIAYLDLDEFVDAILKAGKEAYSA